MFSNPKLYPKFLLSLAMLPVVFIGCKRDNDVNTNTAFYHIIESEKLVIPATVDLPSNKPGEYKRVATYYAVGVQQYKAQPKAGSSPVTYEWVFVAPKAKLYDISNEQAGTHTAGPTWQLSAADSIYGQQFSPPRTAPSPDGKSIDWLLLKPKDGKTPTGIFTNVIYIQRIATRGGKAPARLPESADETAEVKYTAVYRFTKKN